VLILSGSTYSRRAATVFNHGSASLYLGVDANVSVNNFYVKITSGSFYDMEKPVTTHEIWGVWDGANGWAMITDRRSGE
jgi:hypothetical protein